MSAYEICYDLQAPGQKYDRLIEKIKSYGIWCHLQQSVWVVSTTQSAKEIRDNLATCLDSNDKLFVARLSGEAAWIGYSEEQSSWLKKQLDSQMAA